MLVGDVGAASLVRRVEDLLPDSWRDRGRTRRRIAVLSGITANNIGDDAMLVATVRGLRRLDPDAELVVLAEDPSRCGEVAAQIDAEILSSPQLAVQRILAGRPEGASAAAPILRLARTLISHREEILAGAPVSGLTEAELEGLRTLMGADGVVDCGGANLSGHWRSYFYEKCLDYLVAAKPLSVLGQGIDPADDPEDVALLNLALSVASEVTVREAVTLEYLESIGSPAAVRVTGDDAADLDPSPDARRDALLAAAGADPQEPYIGFQFRHYLDYSAGDALGELAAHLDATAEATGPPVVGVPMHFHDCDERDHLRALRGRMARPERFLVVEDHLTPGDAKALFAGGRIAIGISYHSAIFSLTSGVPYMGLHRGTHYTQKMQGLARLFALPEIAVPLDGASPGAVAAHATDLLARRDAVSTHLLARTAAIRADVAASRRRFLDRVPHPAARAAETPVPVGALAWGDLRRTSPVSREWGFDRGRPVDRFYIERFMERNADRVRGVVCELLNDDYARRYGGDRVARVEILDIDEDNPRATILDDLTAPVRTPEGAFDCFILTQVLPYIHECGAALATVYRSLAPGGSVLVTAPSVIRYHREPEDHWRFTVDSLRRLALDHCPGAEIAVEGHGNVLAASAFLYGLACEELTAEELEVDDPEFPLVITARVTRPA